MNVSKIKNSNRFSARRQNQNGSVIIESTVAMGFLLSLALPFFLYLAILGYFFIYQAQLATVASKVALHATDRNLWLGLPRPNAGASTSVPEENLAQKLCKQLNTVELVKSTITVDNSRPDAIICTCDIEAKMKYPFQTKIGNIDLTAFTPSIVHTQGVASLLKVSPYATVKLDGQRIMNRETKAPFPDKQRVIAFIPAYGFSQQGETQAASNLGLPYKSMMPNNNVSINVWPFNKSAFDYLGVQFKREIDDSRSFWPAYFHSNIGGTAAAQDGSSNYAQPKGFK